MPCPSGVGRLKIIGWAKHVGPGAEHLRTRVRFPPPPPTSTDIPTQIADRRTLWLSTPRVQGVVSWERTFALRVCRSQTLRSKIDKEATKHLSGCWRDQGAAVLARHHSLYRGSELCLRLQQRNDLASFQRPREKVTLCECTPMLTQHAQVLVSLDAFGDG